MVLRFKLLYLKGFLVFVWHGSCIVLQYNYPAISPGKPKRGIEMLFKLSESNIISRNCAACEKEMVEYTPIWVIPKKDEDGFDSAESEIFCSYKCFSSKWLSSRNADIEKFVDDPVFLDLEESETLLNEI